MKGLTSEERALLESAASYVPIPETYDDFEHLTEAEVRVLEKLKCRGVVKESVLEWEDANGEWIGEYYEATPLGKIALNVCSVDGKFSGISW